MVAIGLKPCLYEVQMSKLKVQMFVIIFLFITGYIPIPIGSPIVIAGNGVGQGIRGLNEENRLLEVEIGLAQEKKSYLILNPSTKKIYLKNGGFTMREFDIAKIRYWRERGQTIEPIILVKKRALFYPKRKEIKPSKKEGGTDTTTHTEIDFLELGDMPYRYTLLFEKGVGMELPKKKRLCNSRPCDE
ncbi:MAG: hypothetical protein HZC45_09655 [Deltaproteobacteria bacterium]|nr:hypothetical protein [Deltaproteobacteria bacterium]